MHDPSAAWDREAPYFGWSLAALLIVGFAGRLAYLAAQAATDPWFAFPMADAAANLEWARERAAGVPAPRAAFDMPPLYPFLLGLLFRVAGEKLGLVYFLQHLLTVGAAGLLALAARRLAGGLAGLSTCGLFLLYQPLLFFASRTLGEPLAIALLCAALCVWVCSPRAGGGLASGLLVGLACLARPNLGLVVPLWASYAWRRSAGRTALLLVSFAVALIPTTVRNYTASGHWVPIASNAGLTLYHGNGPKATGFIEQLRPAGVGKGVQAEDAARLASERSGKTLDVVEADRYWGREAIRERLAHPWETVRLVLWRGALLAWNGELTLVMGPRQDPNPLRWLAPLPFAPLLGLAAAGVALAGWRGTGGWSVWSAVVACALAPLVFFVSCRYRLPFAALLTLPAGIGLVALLRPAASVTAPRRRAGWLVGATVVAASLAVPGDALLGRADAWGLVARARAWKHAGASLRAEADLRRAVDRYPGWAPSLYELGAVLVEMGREQEAETIFRRLVQEQPGYANAACALGEQLNYTGRHAEAVPILRQGLAAEADHPLCWSQLLSTLALLERWEELDQEIARADAAGVKLGKKIRQRLERMRAGTEPAGPATGAEGEDGE